MNVAFTICSNNYLSQAKTLGDSLIQRNPDFIFIIGIVDKPSPIIDYSLFKAFRLIFVEELNIIEFNEMVLKYNIVELNTSVKPFYFDYIFKKYECSFATYFDPDIMVFNKLDELIKYQKLYNILLTPHILSPIKIDDTHPQESHFLRFGVYNFGFVSVKNDISTSGYINWWKERMKTQCINSPQNGLFVDQLLNNFTPIFFQSVGIINHPGYNMAHWNLHERTLSKKMKMSFVNDTYPLVFYHFSRYKIEQFDKISRHNTKYDFSQRPDLIGIHEAYSNSLVGNNYNEIISINCYYKTTKKEDVNNKKIKKKLLLGYGIRKVLKRIRQF